LVIPACLTRLTRLQHLAFMPASGSSSQQASSALAAVGPAGLQLSEQLLPLLTGLTSLELHGMLLPRK
jgi:hypothetical protein